MMLVKASARCREAPAELAGRGAGLVPTRKKGTAGICELNRKPLRAVSDWLRDYEAFWDESLRNLKRYVEETP
jgi:hypothetical protein